MKPVQPFRFRLKPRPGVRRRGHIAVALLAMLIGVGLVPVVTMSWKLIGENRTTLSTEQQAYQVLLATSIAYELDLHVDGLRSELSRVAHTLGAAVRRSGTIPTKEIESALGAVADPRVAYIRYSYFGGDAVRSVNAGEYLEVFEPVFKASMSRAAEHHARAPEADAVSQTFLSDPLPAGQGHPALLAVAAPVVSGGSFRGVLTAMIDMDRVWRSVSTRTNTGQLLFAVDERGEVFASNDPNKLAPGTDVRDWAIVENFLNQPKRNSRLATPFEIERDEGAERFIGLYELTRQGWGIFVQARDEEIYWVVGAMVRNTRTLTLILLGVAILAALFFARTLSNPINRLAVAARALAGGDLSARADVRSRNEIGELADTFNAMAEEIGNQIRRLKQAFADNNELFLGTIRALAQAIDAKDPYTRGHSVRVNRYSMIIAREMGLADADLRDLHVSSLLHDVGKIGIDDAILKKNGRLTDEEYEIIKTHAALGATIMSPIRQMKNMLPGLRHHHERCNGRGYPDGLARDEIPQMARIIAVADTFDAITTVRPYQEPMTFEDAVARINELRGVALDAPVVDAFNAVCDRGLLRPGVTDDTEDAAIPPPPEIDLAPIDEPPGPSTEDPCPV